MNDHLTLLRLLEDSGKRVLVYDVGRRIGAIPRDLFGQFEDATTPYPLPMQRKAWFALVQIDPEVDDEPLIWFLHLVLDERGLLIPAQRDYLLDRLLESAQASQRGDDAQTFMHDNPHAFTPREDRMALFHAKLSADLDRPPSRFYDHALDYFSGKPGWDQWEFVGYQGIADVACRHPGAPLADAIDNLPREPLVALCHCLESQSIDDTLLQALQRRLRSEATAATADANVLAALVRGMALRAREAEVQSGLSDLLERPAGGEIELLAAIAGRSWECLEQPQILRRFLQRLADNSHGQPVFEHCVNDLLSLPALAGAVRAALHADDAPVEVSAAFDRMKAALKTGPED
jgi:hypothetical protein